MSKNKDENLDFDDENHMKTPTFESLITLTIVPYINGKKQKEKFEFDKTINISVSEAASEIAVKYGLTDKDVKLRIPDENDNPLYTIPETEFLSKLDTSLIYACFDLPKSK